MRVRAEVGVVFANGKHYTQGNVFELEDERANELLEYGAVIRWDEPQKEAPAKRGPGRPRKTES